MSDLLIILDDTGAIESISDGSAQAFGYTAQDLIGKPSNFILEIPGRPSHLIPPLGWLGASPHPLLHGVHREGQRFPLRLTQHDLHGSGQTHIVLLLQNPDAVVGTDSDLLRHQSLHELATFEGRISVWEVDFRTNHFVASPVLGHILGLAPEQVPTTVAGWTKYFHPDDWKLIERDAGRMLRREIDEMNVECRILHADGSIRWGLVRGKATFDEHGQAIRAVGTNIDITERKLAEQERDLIFTLSLDLLCVADLHGFRRVNPAFCKVLGYDIDELTSRPFLDFVHPDDVEATKQVVAGLQQGKDLIFFENRYRCKDGSYRWLSWKTPAPVAGTDLLYAVARDVTDAKRVQAELSAALAQAERANQAKSEFLSRMSHELRTPLNAILGFGQLLQRDPLSPRQHDQIDLVVKAGRHLLTLINEVLDITRIEVGRLDVSPEPVDVAEIVREVIGLIQPLADVRDIHVYLDESVQRSCFVTADKQRLKQVLLNLTSNAIKYNFDNGRVYLRSEISAQGRLRLHVQDTGPGIPLDKQHRLFVPFDRLGAESTAIEGSGLGLVLSRRLVEVMAGSLTFQSQPESGTTFTLELPLAQVAQPGVMDKADGATARSQVVGPARTLLCIEDNLANIRLIEAVLASRPNVRVETAMQAHLGIESARRHHPDLILLDVHLPDMKGDEVLALLRAEPALRDIPVVVISADATAHQIDRLLNAGASAYVTKPIDVDQLLQILDRFLAQEAPTP